MNKERQTQLANAQVMLVEARSLNETGQHGAAMKQAYDASEHVAVAYLMAITGQHLPPNDATYDLFAKIIREPNRHPASLQKIREIVGDVCALREAYEPALLDETAPQEARQMIECAVALDELVRKIEFLAS